ncbi:MAG: S8 family serine peptidase [Polyangiaceae bacterium]
MSENRTCNHSPCAMKMPLTAGLVLLLSAIRSAPAQADMPSFGPSGSLLGGEARGDEAAPPAEVAGEVAIDLRDGATASDIARLSRQYGVTLRPNSVWSETHDKLEVGEVAPDREGALLEALSHDALVEHAEPMAIYRESFVPNDPLYATKQWHLKRVGAERAWGYTCGRGITVAVVDTGIACFDKGPFSRGTDLAATRCEGGWNFVSDTAEAYDDQGHGTHVAGTIAQTTDNGMGAAGLAFCATLMPVKVLNRQGFGTVANVAEGIRYAADHGAEIINMSLGGPIKSKILEDAVRHALDAGVVIVAAAGNSGRSVGWPAAYPGVLAVSATDDKDAIASFSSRGPEVGIAAPGVGVTQQTVCNGGRDRCEIFGTFSGTSMASPHVAGVAALIESLGVTRGASVRRDLAASARSPGDGPLDETLYGAGIVDAGRAAAGVFWSHFALRLLALIGLGWAVRRRILKRGGSVVPWAGAVSGAMLAGVGLAAFAGGFGLSARAGALGTWLSLAVRPLGDWDLVLWGAGVHAWWLLASALPAASLIAVGFSSRRVRPFIGGVALGTAALLCQMAWSGDSAFVAGMTLGRLWAAANVCVCLWIARVALDAGRRRHR